MRLNFHKSILDHKSTKYNIHKIYCFCSSFYSIDSIQSWYDSTVSGVGEVKWNIKISKSFIHILDSFGFVSDLLSNVFGKLFSLIQAEDAERREKNLEEAKKIVIEEDKSLPAPKQVLCLDSQGEAEVLGTKENMKLKTLRIHLRQLSCW